LIHLSVEYLQSTDLQDHDLIESNFKIISGGRLHDTYELTTSEGFIIYEKLSISSINFYLSCG